MRLEDLKPEATVRGVLPATTVTVVSIRWFGLELKKQQAEARRLDEAIWKNLKALGYDA